MTKIASTLPTDLQNEISRAGYYPALVTQIVEVALGGEQPLNYLVQAETTFDETIHRHLTVLVLTPTRLIAGHVDDSDDEDDDTPMAMGTTDAIPLNQIRAVGLTHVITNPAHTANHHHKAEEPTAELAEMTLAISWGGQSRLEMGPATCGDPGCEGDHGYLGAIMPDDLLVRIASAADGPEATAKALDFARALSAATVTGVGNSGGGFGRNAGVVTGQGTRDNIGAVALAPSGHGSGARARGVHR